MPRVIQFHFQCPPKHVFDLYYSDLFIYLLTTDIFIFTHSFYSLSYGNGWLQEENQKNVCRFENVNIHLYSFSRCFYPK